MSATSSFSELVDRFREANPAKRSKGGRSRPMTYSAVAKKLGISRTQLYNLLNGEQGAGDAFEKKLAKGLGLAQSTVHKSLNAAQTMGRS